MKQSEKRLLIVILGVLVLTTVTAFAQQSVNNFTDYNPPDELFVYWGDYLKDGNASNGYSPDNAKTSYPKWSAEYPYRAVFMGSKPKSSVTQKHESFFYVVYSKKPTTDIFTFEHLSYDAVGSDATRYGRIRATTKLSKVDIGQDVIIVGPAGGLSTALSATGIDSTLLVNYPSSWSNPFDVLHISGSNIYFDFDFYFDCASEHNQNASDLKISGLTSISSVPYKYIIHCVQHTGWTGNGSGGDGSGSSGGSGSSSSGGLSGNLNNNGVGGSHGWGGGDYGGGVDKNTIVSGNDGGGYASRPDMDLSVPEDWKKPIDDNYNSMPDSEYKPDYPKYIPAEGDTGQTGGTWKLPEFGNDDGVSGTISGYKELKPKGEYGLIDFMAPMEEWLE